MTIAAIDKTPSDQSDRAALSRLFNDTRKRLVETGTRNRLVHVNRANARANVVNIVNERSDDVHAILSGHKVMRLLAIGSDRDGTNGGICLADADGVDFDSDRYTDAQLETRMGPDALQKRLLKIAREAQTAEEESGVNILYLALGFLTWFEDKSSAVAREAPLVLLPVELVRNQRTSTYDLRIRDEDVLTNLPLQQRLKDDFGIELPDIEIEEEWKPATYFGHVEEVIAGRTTWKVDHNGIQLGFFSFSKLLMHRDLAIDVWPDGAIAEHDLTRRLLFEGFGSEAPLFGPNDRLDEVLPPEKLFHVVDADASQARVIEEVRLGRNLVVQGPPGTGKSQTITNIIAAAAKEGKRVLFIAEKMAALSVVRDRLMKVGLRDICLELHSRSANKKVVLAELARTIGAAAAVPALPGAPISLTETRDKLNLLAETLHRPIGTTGETAFSVLSVQARYIGLGVPAPTITGDALALITREQERQLLEKVACYGELIKEEGADDQHPFAGTQNLDLQPLDLARLAGLLEKVRVAVMALAEAVRGPASALRVVSSTLSSATAITDLLDRLEGLPAGAANLARAILSAPDLPRFREAIEAGAAWRSARDAAGETFIEAAFASPTTALRGPLVAGARSIFARWGGAYRRASRELAGLLRGALPKPADERVELVDRLDDIGSRKVRWEDDKNYCVRILGDAWRGERTDFARILAITAWCNRVGAATLICSHDALLALAQQQDVVSTMRRALLETEPTARRGLEEVVHLLKLDLNVFGELGLEKADLGEVAARVGAMALSTDRYAAWANLARLHHRLVAAGVADLARRMRAGEFDGAAAAVELRFARAERLWRVALESSPVLRGMALEKRHDLVREFAFLERKRLSENVTGILAGHLVQVPQGAMGEMRVIRGEIGKKRGHIAVRKLFSIAGTAVQRIKPVLLMSPISVAQFLPPGKLTFDLLVIDEASQVRPEDALGAIARAKQIVVVGDQKQLPPSSFFDRLLDDDVDEDADDEGEGEDLLGGAAKLGSMESILSLCEARGVGSRMLQWHYRSRDPSLIQVSNREFYDGALILPPSPLQEDPAYGLCFSRVEGVYDKGGKRDNRKEGEAIVGRVAEHARMHPQLSLGIVTFSSSQKNLITELLELARRSDATLDAFLREGQAEDVFVKNIENVQGDERDVILVSICYGPITPGGRLTSMTFGPVNQEGGERRLNVLFTRARVRCEVFASFDPGDIDPSRTSRDGARILKRFLDFAKNGRIDIATPTGEIADTPFEEDVADVIRSLGYLADPQVGSAGFRIDMGVRHPDRPGTYVLAVECDGATYHSALWARERDRLRQDVLEHLGWCFHRIWSTDWFYNRRAEIERLQVALSAAREVVEDGARIEGANRARPVPDAPVQTATDTFEVPEAVARQMPPYQRAHFPVNSRQEPHEVAVSRLADLAKRIVSAEGPIHIDETARRLAACFGKEKAGSRIVKATYSALVRAQSSDRDLLSDGTFWFTRVHSMEPPVRDRSAENGATLKAANISMLEIKAALKIAKDDNAGGTDADLIRTAARLLGFRRVGSDLQERLAAGLVAVH